MAEKIISPGVFTNEIDQSFLPTAVAEIGAALIGPTLKGPAGIPTIVTSFSDFRAKFGDVVKSGSDSVQFLTSHAAEEYLKNSDTLTVVRVMDGVFSSATASISTTGSATDATSTFASASLLVRSILTSSITGAPDEFSLGGVDFTFVSSSADLNNSATQIFVPFSSDASASAEGAVDAINNSSSLHGLEVAAARSGDTIIISASVAGTAGNSITLTTGSNTAGPFLFTEVDLTTKLSSTGDNATGLQGGTDGAKGTSFVLRTIADGTIMNNFAHTIATDGTGDLGTNQVLISGSTHNVRYEVSNVNSKKGTFTLVLRAGNDNVKRKQILETFTGLTLDPNSPNYIGKAIGDQRQTVQTDGSTKYLELSGSFRNKSRLVTVESVENIVDYLDENGDVRDATLTGSLPLIGSGSGAGGFGGGLNGQSGFDALGNHIGAASDPINFYENISTQTQGFTPSNLTDTDG